MEWLQRLSLRALRHRFDKRRLQEEMDMHRLYLLTTYHAQGEELLSGSVEELDQAARDLGLEGTRAAVAAHLRDQVLSTCRMLHSALEAAGDETRAARGFAAPAAAPPVQEASLPQRGLGAAMGPALCTPSAQDLEQTLEVGSAASGLRHLTQRQVAQAFLRASAFTLEAAPSSVEHADSGDGLWLRGEATVGQVVALYPGVAYSPLHHRQIPGYPLVASSNPYLLSRFDGTVLDAKPWGRGSSGRDAEEGHWPAGPQNEAEAALARLEGRNPLALAHLANHPPGGTPPNVVIAAFDVDLPAQEAPLELRAYLPTQHYGSLGAAAAVPGLALVALRALRDEELFLNYRLNPNAPSGLPRWYTPVDAEEDARRWS